MSKTDNFINFNEKSLILGGTYTTSVGVNDLLIFQSSRLSLFKTFTWDLSNRASIIR